MLKTMMCKTNCHNMSKFLDDSSITRVHQLDRYAKDAAVTGRNLRAQRWRATVIGPKVADIEGQCGSGGRGVGAGNRRWGLKGEVEGLALPYIRRGKDI